MSSESVLDDERERLRKGRLKDYFSNKSKPKKLVLKNKKKGPSVFDNPFAKHAFDKLSQKEKDYYKALGERLYDDNMISNTEEDALTKNIKDSCAYITASLNSGLDPKELTNKERNVLVEVHGKQWYKVFDYDVEDI